MDHTLERNTCVGRSASHYTDLLPVITYRHAQSFNLGVKDPLRVIALCDSDAFYASCETIRLELDPDIPLVVQQWGSIIAVNYPARSFGIKRSESFLDAQKKCSTLVEVHVATIQDVDTEPKYRPWSEIDDRPHNLKISLDHYRKESAKVHNMFKDGLGSAEFEKASIDEAFINFTKPVREILLERYPHLAQTPGGVTPDTPLPSAPTMNWDEACGTIVPVNNADEDKTVPTTWHDVCLCIAAELMEKLRREIHARLGYTTSAGIARNKSLAKLAASYKKFDNQTILRNAAIPNYLCPMQFQKIRFLGGKLGRSIAEKYEASTIEELLPIPVEELQRGFGDGSLWVWQVLRGIDRSEVKEKPIVPKTMLASKNLATAITKASEGPYWIRVLAADLAMRLNEARKISLAVWPKTLVVSARDGDYVGDYSIDGRSKQGPFPFVKDLTSDVVAAAAESLWKELFSDTRGPLKVMNVGLTFTGIEAAESGQRSIEGWFSGVESSSSSKRPREGDDMEGNEEPLPPTYMCSRCDKKITLSFDDEESMLKKGEHDDFHFAQDLARSAGSWKVGERVVLGSGSIEPVKKKRKKDPPSVKGTGKAGGIASFFAPKK